MSRNIQTIALDLVKLDLENVRFGSDRAATQKEALQLLMEDPDDAKKLFKLAEDISKHGFDPTELQLITPGENGDYIVLEGNRRLAATKLLIKPDLCPVESMVNDFLRLRDRSAFAIPNELEFSVVDTRTKGDRWVEIKHTGQNQGVGRVRWDSNIIDERKAKRTGVQSVGSQVRKLIADNPGLFPNEAKVNADQIAITTLTRLFQSKPAQEFFKLKLESKVLTPKLPLGVIAPSVSHALQRFIDSKLNVKDVMSDRDRSNFIQSIPADLSPVYLLQNNIQSVDDNDARENSPEEAGTASVTSDLPPENFEPAPENLSEETESPNIAAAPDINTDNNSDTCNGSDDDSKEVRGSNDEKNSEDETSHRPMAAPENVQASASNVEGNVGEVKPGAYTPDPLNNASGESASNNSGDNSSDLNNNGQLPNANDQETAASLTNNNESKPRFKRDRKRRKYLIDWNMKITNPKVNQIYRELKGKLVVDEMPNAAGIVFRVFLETSCDAFISAQDQAGTPVMKHDKQDTRLLDAHINAQTLKTKVLSVAKHQEEQLKTLSRPDHKGIKGRAANDLIGSIDYFHQLVHGTTTPALSNELNQVADVYAPLLKAIWPTN